MSISENAKNSKPESLPQRAQQTRETSVNYNPKDVQQVLSEHRVGALNLTFRELRKGFWKLC